MFTDPEFPPCFASFNCSVEAIQGRRITWQRISSFANDLTFMDKDISTLKIEAANPRDAYFLPTISALAKDRGKYHVLGKVFPSEWYPEDCRINTNGIYRLIAKVRGVATEVCIDDWVPVYADSGRPVFSKLVSKSVWILLLEKAWAKLKGSYGAIMEGCSFEVLNTFCLAPTVRHSLTDLDLEQQKAVWKHITEALD